MNNYGGESRHMDELEIASRACNDILKTHFSYIHGLGNGHKPSKSSTSYASSRRATNVELKNELASAKDELETTRASLHIVEGKIIKLEETVEANRRMMVQVFERIAPDILQSFIGKFSCSAPPPS